MNLPKYGQSPIDLDNSIVHAVKYPPLILNGYWLNEGEATLTNNGTTAMVTLSGDRIPSTITGGPLFNEEYELHNAHFHWGKENCNGAEHTINGTWFSMEAHCLHWNRKYLTFEDAEKHKDGLVKLGYFFLVNGNNEWDNPMLQKITDNLMYIVEANSEVKIPANSLCWVREALHSPGYYVYYGSRTTWPFKEGIIWIIFPIILSVSANQMDAFRKLKNGEGKCILSNCRCIQLLRGRKIFWALNSM
ncbi:carbonic anhydrase [Cephus cinctus]|uniref:Carbonic anhydrase n=1 Tax=Cephus cinctus TaxID=211228 RepID=A0AAJ7CB51_CEPCN|nr:carbonic anhydrase [Cephus cinctus]